MTRRGIHKNKPHFSGAEQSTMDNSRLGLSRATGPCRSKVGGAGIWLRVSSEDQKRDAVERYVEARGSDVTARFIEQGGRRRRPVPQERRRDPGQRPTQAFDTVIFRGDRSFRTAGKGYLFIGELIPIGRAFVSVEDGIDTSTPAGELMAKMAILMAE
ncbi:MAG TPA: recombinase family protein [Anaeromyxobacteraceae bacterium]|nr:recombinase family protein [Anaeromyxobacteraceae bacterium]